MQTISATQDYSRADRLFAEVAAQDAASVNDGDTILLDIPPRLAVGIGDDHPHPDGGMTDRVKLRWVVTGKGREFDGRQRLYGHYPGEAATQ